MIKKLILLISIVFFFFGCSSKEKSLNKNMDSIFINKDIYISEVPKMVDSNFKIGIKTGSYHKNFGINIGTVFIPKVKNTNALELEKAIKNYNINLENLVFTNLNKNFKNDSHYKSYYVPFGGDYEINIEVLSYKLFSSLLSDKYQIKFNMKILIKNKNSEIIYEKAVVTKSLDEKFTFSKEEILSNKNILIKSLDYSLDDVVFNLINDMKKH